MKIMSRLSVALCVAAITGSGFMGYAKQPIDSYFTHCEPLAKRHSGSSLKAYEQQGYHLACDNQKLGRIPYYINKYGHLFFGNGCNYDTSAGEYHCVGAKKVTQAPAGNQDQNP